MYEAYFGLRSRPFAETLDPACAVALPARAAVGHRLRYALEHGPGPALVAGVAGSGKTFLARRLAESFGGPTLYLDYPAMPADALLAYLADELGAPPSRVPGLAGSVLGVRSALSAAGARTLLVVDEAQTIDDPATFEALRLVGNFATGGVPDLALLLVGTPDVFARLPDALADRLAATCELPALTRSETAAYLHGRLTAAGAADDGPPLFDREAITALHAAALGLPRRINRLADLALLVAFARGRERPDLDAVAAAVAESGLDTRAA